MYVLTAEECVLVSMHNEVRMILTRSGMQKQK